MSAQELGEAVPELAGRIDLAVGKSYGANVAVAPRVLTQLGVEGRLVRGRNGGHWRVSRPQWTLMEGWLGEPVRPSPAAEGYAALVERWLRSFGPGTEDDLVWWLGATKAAVRAALTTVGAVEVRLEDGSPAYLHPDDTDPVEPPEQMPDDPGAITGGSGSVLSEVASSNTERSSPVSTMRASRTFSRRSSSHSGRSQRTGTGTAPTFQAAKVARRCSMEFLIRMPRRSP